MKCIQKYFNDDLSILLMDSLYTFILLCRLSDILNERTLSFTYFNSLFHRFHSSQNWLLFVFFAIAIIFLSKFNFNDFFFIDDEKRTTNSIVKFLARHMFVIPLKRK